MYDFTMTKEQAQKFAEEIADDVEQYVATHQQEYEEFLTQCFED